MATSRFKNLPHQKHFAGKLIRNFIVGFIILLFSLGLGVSGYMYFFKLNLVDSIYNASMILAGMGPVDTTQSDGGKLFASFYAIYSGVAFLTSVALIFAPILHRFLHKFQLDIEE